MMFQIFGDACLICAVICFGLAAQYLISGKTSFDKNRENRGWFYLVATIILFLLALLFASLI